ncbi:MAG: hypothetical protein PHE67_09405 [Campylobacterales bacterium]|nr:hypothetical protein [Campylobacterales bacterium]
MVSRIGICLQIISIALFGGDYYFTYKITSQNISISYESLQISKAMTKPEKKPYIFFEIPNDKHVKTEKDFVNEYSEEIVDLILQNSAEVKSISKIQSSTVFESATVRSSPTLVNVDFKEDFGIIGLYQTP